MDDDSLDRLVELAKAGDAEAFGRIFDEFHGPIYRFIASRVGRPSDAEDLTQTVFVRAFVALPRYEIRGAPFGGWLFRLARNATIDYVRTNREHADLVVATGRASEDRGPEGITLLRTDLDAVAGALRKLTPEQREVIILRFFAGLTPREVGELMDRHEGTIRGLQFRAIEALRRALGVKTLEEKTEEAKTETG
jgi:RNA polymerase sigma-70 factor (ECF subfamily)